MTPTIKAGMIALQKNFDATANGKHGAVTFKFTAGKNRQFITMLIGAKPKENEMPTEDQLEGLMGEIGYFSGNDITEVFGETGFKKLEKFLLNKWNKKK